MKRLPSGVMAVAVLSGFLLVVAGERLYPLLQPDTALTLPHDPTCDLHQGNCSSRLPAGGNVMFGIEPRTLPVLQPLALNVSTTDLKVNQVEVHFSGVDMNMGINRTTLQAAGEGKFSGSIIIPVCIRNGMEWEAKVLLHTPDGIIAAPYRFWSKK